MKAQDVVLQLAEKLAALSPEFTDNVAVTTLASSAGSAVVATATVHGFVVGQGVVISGAQIPIVISAISRVGIVATATTDADHDLTEFTPVNVEIADAVDTNFNGTKKLLSVPSRRTFTFQVDNTGATADTGSLLNGTNAFTTYNGVFKITLVPTTTSFIYGLGMDFAPATGTITASGNARISAVATMDRVSAVYTKQAVNDYWLFVVLGDVAASKNRSILSDAVDDQQRQSQGEDFRQQIVQPVNLVLAVPSSAEISGRTARDAAEDMFLPICQSILFKLFNSGLSVGAQSPLQCTGHGFLEYNKATYLHQYSFQQTVDLTFDDTVGRDIDVAFRDMDITISQNLGVEQLTAVIDLDDEPL